jgi:alkylation response protein AidB-like acyl-CoA dehydrogenase
MLETAILKVFSTEALWEGSYETLQVHGGQGYFTDEPYERYMRDARINTIGEGANEVLKAFIALVGMRDTGEGFKATLEGLKSPSRFVPTLWRFGRERFRRLALPARVTVSSAELRPAADLLARRVSRFPWAIERTLVKHREAVLDRQYIQERIADAAIALFTASCTLARLDRELTSRAGNEAQRAAGRLYLKMANRTFDRALRALDHNDDDATTRAADAALKAYVPV